MIRCSPIPFRKTFYRTSKRVLTKEFNALPLNKKSKLVFGEGKLIGTIRDQESQKAFFYKLNDLKIDVIYDKVRNRLLGINAWESAVDRTKF
jgi:hypothetical protein